MTLSDNSLKAPSLMILSLAIGSMISPAEAQVTCSSASPQCCWVIFVWQKMGQTSLHNQSSTTACCYFLGTTTQATGVTGVSCTSDGNVTSIDWKSRSLSGSIPSEIGNLVSLQTLNLLNNSLTGSIPSSIGNLTSLRYLTLSRNQLTGAIPSQIGNLVSLQTLNLWNSTLSGSIPSEIGNLVNLQWLSLGFNQLSGSIPSSIGNLTKLLLLNLQNNMLTGSIPSQIGNLVSLQTLNLWSNILNGSIPSQIGNLVSLQTLNLGNNTFTGSIPSSLGTLVNLQMLYLQNNILTGSIPSQIGNLASLQTLYLWNNKLTGSIPSEIGKLVNLQWLSLGFNQLSGSIPSSIGNLVNLQKLNIQNNILNGSIPPEIGNLVNLQTLCLVKQNLTGIFTPLCSTDVYVYTYNGNSYLSGTGVIVCGCASQRNPANLFPPDGTSIACLATGPATSLEKRVEIFSQNIGSYRITCHVDDSGNPFQDCLNAQAYICNPSDIGSNAARLSECKNGIDKMVQGMSILWRAVRRQCGQWSFDSDGFKGSYPSLSCASANSELTANAYYLVRNPETEEMEKVPITAALTNSVNAGLWSNPRLRG